MSFSQRLLLKGKPIWESCLRHPFYREWILTYATEEYNNENDKNDNSKN